MENEKKGKFLKLTPPCQLKEQHSNCVPMTDTYENI